MIDDDIDKDGLRPLIDAAARGDAVAIERLATWIEPTIRRAARRELAHADRARVDTDDVLQETLVRVVERLELLEFRGAHPFDAWVARVAERTARMARRHHHARRRDIRAQRPLDGVPEPRAIGTTPTQSARRRERARSLEEAIALLTPGQRRVVELHSLHGEPFDEVARRLDLGCASSARSLFARALRRLEILLAERDDGKRET